MSDSDVAAAPDAAADAAPGAATVAALAAAVEACRSLISQRFPQPGHHGAAAMLLADGTILTGTSPEPLNASVSVCHEIEPYCAAFRLGQAIVASVCLHRTPEDALLVLSPCGVCQERLATHGPEVLVGVPSDVDVHRVRWVRLGELMPHYWLRAFPEEVPSWMSQASRGTRGTRGTSPTSSTT